MKIMLIFSLLLIVSSVYAQPPVGGNNRSSRGGAGEVTSALIQMTKGFFHAPRPAPVTGNNSTVNSDNIVEEDEQLQDRAAILTQERVDMKRRVEEASRQVEEQLAGFCATSPFGADPGVVHNEAMRFFSQVSCDPFPFMHTGVMGLISTSALECVMTFAEGLSPRRINQPFCNSLTRCNPNGYRPAQIPAQNTQDVKLSAIKREIKAFKSVNRKFESLGFALSSQGFTTDEISEIGKSSCNTATLMAVINSGSAPSSASESDRNKNCDSGECAKASQLVDQAFRDELNLPSASQAELLSSFNLDRTSSCFDNPKHAWISSLLPFDTKAKDIELGKLRSQKPVLQSVISEIGDCDQTSRLRLVTRSQSISETIKLNKKIDTKEPSIWLILNNYNPGFEFLLSSLLESGTSGFSEEACSQVKSYLEKSASFISVLEQSLQSTNPSQALESLVLAHVQYLAETTNSNNKQLLKNNIEMGLKKECDAFANKVKAISCSTSAQLNASSNILASHFNFQGGDLSCKNSMSPENNRRCMERNLGLCQAVQREGQVSALDAVLFDSSNPRNMSLQTTPNESGFGYCPGFDEFVASQGLCRNASNVGRCVRRLGSANHPNAEQFAEIRRNFRAQMQGPLRAMHDSLPRISNLHPAKVNEVVSQLDAQQMASAIVAVESGSVGTSESERSEFESVSSVFGGIPSSHSSINFTDSDSKGSLFNAATTQAFGSQARVSAATSGAVMSRFIAAVPPMQNMPQQQQRQQMDQALERSVNQTVAELENKASGATSASERQKYLDEIAELRRLMADQTARNDLITQQMAAMNQAPAEETQAAPTKRRRAPASVANASPESPEVQSTGFQTGGGRSSGGSASSGSVGGSQDLAGAQGFGGGAAAAGRSVSSVSEARDAAPNDNSLRLVVGGAGGQVIPAAQVITISVPSGDEQALKDAILGQRERLNVGEDGYAVVEVIDPASGRASLVRVKIENDNVIVQNFTAEQLRNTTIVSEANPQPRQIRYSLQAMTNLLNQASGGSN